MERYAFTAPLSRMCEAVAVLRIRHERLLLVAAGVPSTRLIVF